MKIEWIIVPFLTATLAGCSTNSKPKTALDDELISYSVNSNSNYTQILAPEQESEEEKNKKKKSDSDTSDNEKTDQDQDPDINKKKKTDSDTSEGDKTDQDQDTDTTKKKKTDSDTSEATISTTADTDKVLNLNVRKALIKEDGLSTNAKNIRVIANDGTVTLRGIVDNDQEKQRIENAIKNVDGVKKIDNQLDVKNIEMGG